MCCRWPGAADPHRCQPFPYLKSSSQPKPQRMSSTKRSGAGIELLLPGKWCQVDGRAQLTAETWHCGIHTSVPGAAQSWEAVAPTQWTENRQHHPALELNPSPVSVMRLRRRTPAARNTKCIFIIHYACAWAVSAEVQSPGGEILQPMAFPKEKEKNQECHG